MKKLNPEHIKVAMQYSDEIPFHKLTGIKLTDLSENGAKIELKVRNELTNIRGGIHGGVYAAMLDVCTGWALYCSLEDGESMVTANLTVHDLAVIDCMSDTIYAVGYVVRRGRTLAVCEGRVESPDGRLLALGTATMMVVKGPGTIADLSGKALPAKYIEVPDEEGAK